MACAAVVGLSLAPGVAGWARAGAFVGCLAFAAIGFADDVRGLPVLPRFVLQVLAAAACTPLLIRGLPGSAAARVAAAVGIVLWLTAYANAFNFMDGINGISAMQAVVAGVAWWVLGELDGVPHLAAGGAVVAGAALAFAPYNFPRARVFLGDVGSYFLGAWLAVLLVLGLRAGLAPEAVILPTGLYLADTGMTLVRRFRRHEAWHLPHRDHVYQRLTRLGWSHARVTLGVGAVMTLCAVLGLVSRAAALPVRLGADAVAGGVLVAYLAAPTVVARSRGQVVAQRAGTSP